VSFAILRGCVGEEQVVGSGVGRVMRGYGRGRSKGRMSGGVEHGKVNGRGVLVQGGDNAFIGGNVLNGGTP